ncbi:MAG: hypothetical protein ABIQ44_03645, partial [Chloroflexia bacterium]
RFDLKSKTGTIPLELVKKLTDSGAVFAEVPVHHYHRVYGRSQFFNLPRLWATGVNLLQLWVELALMPRITKRKPVKSVKPRSKSVVVNPSLAYQTEAQQRVTQTGPLGKPEQDKLEVGNKAGGK